MKLNNGEVFGLKRFRFNDNSQIYKYVNTFVRSTVYKFFCLLVHFSARLFINLPFFCFKCPSICSCVSLSCFWSVCRFFHMSVCFCQSFLFSVDLSIFCLYDCPFFVYLIVFLFDILFFSLFIRSCFPLLYVSISFNILLSVCLSVYLSFVSSVQPFFYISFFCLFVSFSMFRPFLV